MRLSQFSKAGAAMALAMAFAATTALAQGNGSDASGPGGAGGGVSGSLGIGNPGHGNGGNAGGAGGGITSGSITGATAGFSNAGSGGVQVTNPASGSSITVSQNVAQGLGQVLSGHATGAPAVTGGLTAGGAMSSGLAGSLVSALQALGSSPSFANLQSAVTAYNNAVNGLNGPVPPALLAVRAALVNIMR